MLCFSVKVAFHPANPLESHSCTSRTSNPLRITLLRKNPRGGEGPSNADSHFELCALCDLCGESHSNIRQKWPQKWPGKRNDMHLGDWIHPPSPRMQQSPRFPADTSALSPCRLSATFLAASLPRHSAGCTHQPTNISNPERSEGCNFLSHRATSAPAAQQSAVDTTRVLPYSAPANDFASPSPPSSSRQSAALDDVCIAIRYHTVLITRWRNGPAGFLFLCPANSTEVRSHEVARPEEALRREDCDATRLHQSGRAHPRHHSGRFQRRCSHARLHERRRVRRNAARS